MDEKEFDERVTRLMKVNEALVQLDPAIRGAAFGTLEEYVTGDNIKQASTTSTQRRKTRRSSAKKSSSAGASNKKESVGDSSNLGRDDFFLKFSSDKPSVNALAIAAWHYNEHGKAAFSLGEIKEIADVVSLTLPDRLDMTFRSALHSKKSCFRTPSKGNFVPTVHGEARLKESFGVKKGNKPKRVDGGDD